MPSIVILTPDEADPGFHTRWREVFERAAQPLRQAAHVEGRSWTAAGDLTGEALVLPLLVWGYNRAAVQWHERVSAWQSEGVRLQNPAEVLRWNADKRYLRRLAAAGAPVTPTQFVDRIDAHTLGEAATQFGSKTLVAKPQVSATAWQTIRWSPGDPLDGGPEGAAMIQPYLPAIETSGEVSLIYFGGVFSHAIQKVPKRGDFRVQPEYDGVISPHRPSADEFAAAEAILAAAGAELLYARVDLVRDLGDKPVLMELELVEPDLYLGFSPDAPAAFARAVTKVI